MRSGTEFSQFLSIFRPTVIFDKFYTLSNSKAEECGTQILPEYFDTRMFTFSTVYCKLK